MDIDKKAQKLIERFNQFSDWEDKYREIIKLGRELPEYSENNKTDKFLIKGCQSQVWLKPSYKDGRVFFEASSDALLVKGIIAVLVFVYSGNEPKDILTFKYDFLKEIGITQHLSLNRTNGLASMFKQIHMYATVYNTLFEKGIFILPD